MTVTIPTLDSESISVNYDDTEIIKAERILTEIVRTINKNDYKTSSNFMANKENAKMLSAFCKVLSTRFGFNIDIKTEDKLNIHTTGLSVEGDTGFKQGKVKLYKAIEKYGTTHDKSILKDIKKMEKEVTDSLFNGKLVLDDKEVKVYGINEDAVAIIWCGLVELINIGTEPKQLMAEIMHEIGHCYYGIRYIHQTRSYNTELSTTLAVVTKDTKNLHKRVQHITINGEPLKDEGTVLNIINLANRTIEASEHNQHNAIKENERLADQFATRFGYGSDLAAGLRIYEKIKGKYKNPLLKSLVYTEYYLMLFKAATVFIPILNTLHPFNRVLSIVIRQSFFNWYIIYLAMSALMPNINLKTNERYDDSKDRLKRIKADINKHIAENPDDKELYTEALSSLEKIENEINNTPSDKTVIQALIQYTTNNDKVSSQIIKDRLSTLAGNDIHSQAAKFSIL